MCKKIFFIFFSVSALSTIQLSFGMDIFQAIKENNVVRAQKILADTTFNVNKTVVNYGNLTEGFNPLHFACWYDNTEVVILLLKHGADVNKVVEAGNFKDQTPLDLTSWTYLRTETAQVLLEHGANIDQEHFASVTNRPELIQLIQLILAFNRLSQIDKLNFIIKRQNVNNDNDFKFLVRCNFGQLINDINKKDYVFVDKIIKDSVFFELLKRKDHGDLRRIFSQPIDMYFEQKDTDYYKTAKFIDDVAGKVLCEKVLRYKDIFFLNDKLSGEKRRFFANLLAPKGFKRFRDTKVKFDKDKDDVKFEELD